MDTLVTYIDRMGEMIRTEQPIAESEALLEEVRNVSVLVADMLDEYADAEIGAAAQVSRRLQVTLTYVVALLAGAAAGDAAVFHTGAALAVARDPQAHRAAGGLRRRAGGRRPAGPRAGNARVPSCTSLRSRSTPWRAAFRG